MPRIIPSVSKAYEDWSETPILDGLATPAPLVAGGIYETFRYGEPEQFICQAVINQRGKVFGRFVRYGVAAEQYEWTPERATSVRLVWAPPIPGSPTYKADDDAVDVGDNQEESSAQIPPLLLQTIVAEQVEAAVANAVSTFRASGPISAGGQVTPDVRISPRTGKPVRSYQKKSAAKK